MATPRKRSILVVDDAPAILDHLCGFFSERGWEAAKASSGTEGLELLANPEWSCDCIILDKKMPGMDGMEFLTALRKRETGGAHIPVIVLSAYVCNDEDKDSFLAQGATRVFQKPEDPSLLEAVAEAILSPMSGEAEKKEKEIDRAISVHEIDERVRHHENLIEEYYTREIQREDFPFKDADEPLLVIARRWNSWYPSFFDVPGGAYAMAFPARENGGRNPIAVVDPGFRFLGVLRDLGLSVRDIETCIVTHNHPDHMGGVFEYIACRYQAGEVASFLCNPSTQRMLVELAQANVTARGLQDNRKEDVVFSYCDAGGAHHSLGVRAFATDHREVGWDSDSKGLILTCHRGATHGAPDSSCQTVILGDSTFDEATASMDFPSVLADDANTRIAVLHIGSAQIKQRTGGHLYLTGLARLVHRVADRLEARQRDKKRKLVVLVSEWGLEHATASQLKSICPGVGGFEEASAIISVVSFLRSSLRDLGYQRMTILPADIGLVVGMVSGEVYFSSPGGGVERVSADEVKFAPGAKGLVYSR